MWLLQQLSAKLLKRFDDQKEKGSKPKQVVADPRKRPARLRAGGRRIILLLHR
jgi:hypothetical protein